MGGSAGAFGTALNCDYVAHSIHATNSEADVRLDSLQFELNIYASVKI